MTTQEIKAEITAQKTLPVPQLQAKIEAMPVEKWKSELAKITDESVRERVRNHLLTVHRLRKR